MELSSFPPLALEGLHPESCETNGDESRLTFYGVVVDWLIEKSRAIIKVLSTLSLEPLIMAVFLPVECPYCHSTDVVKHGQSSYNGKTRYRCCNPDCPRVTFSLNLNYPGRNPEVKKQIVEMTLNGSGVRDISRTLGVSTSTVIKEIKKNPRFSNRSTEKS